MSPTPSWNAAWPSVGGLHWVCGHRGPCPRAGTQGISGSSGKGVDDRGGGRCCLGRSASRKPTEAGPRRAKLSDIPPVVGGPGGLRTAVLPDQRQRRAIRYVDRCRIDAVFNGVLTWIYHMKMFIPGIFKETGTIRKGRCTLPSWRSNSWISRANSPPTATALRSRRHPRNSADGSDETIILSRARCLGIVGSEVRFADGTSRRGLCAQPIDGSAEAQLLRKKRRSDGGRVYPLILRVSDGEPADVDGRGPQYVGHDPRTAVEEQGACGMRAFCLTLDLKADDYVSRISAPEATWWWTMSTAYPSARRCFTRA